MRPYRDTHLTTARFQTHESRDKRGLLTAICISTFSAGMESTHPKAACQRGVFDCSRMTGKPELSDCFRIGHNSTGVSKNLAVFGLERRGGRIATTSIQIGIRDN
jgi:hypothetical protein